MIRRRHPSRYPSMLAAVGLIAAVLTAVPVAAAAETPQGDLFVVASDQGNAGVGGQWWTDDTSITVEVRDDGGMLQATATNDAAPDPNSNYWWGAHTGITVLPGWTVTATGAPSGHSVTTEVTDVVVEGWDNECTVFGTTTYDPSSLRIDVYSTAAGPVNLSRYVTWTTDVDVHSWVADFCVAPGPGESGDAANHDLVDPGGQAIHHDGGLGATMYHFAPAPSNYNPAVRAQPAWNSIWATGWNANAEIRLIIDDDESHDPADPDTFLWHSHQDADGNGQTTFHIDQNEFELLPGHDITATDGTTTKTLEVPGLSLDVDPATGNIHGTTSLPDPSGHFEVLGFSGGTQQASRWIAPVDASFDTNFSAEPQAPQDQGVMTVQPGDRVSVLQVEADGDETEMNVTVAGNEAQSWIRAVVWPEMSIQGEEWDGSDVTVELDKGDDGTVELTETLHADTYQEGRYHDGQHFNLAQPFWDGWTLDAGDRVTVTATSGTTKTTRIRRLAITSVDATANTVTGTATDGDVVTVMRWGDDLGHPHEEVQTTTSSGTWTGTLPDIWPGSQGGAAIRDDEGNATEASWGAAFIAAGIDVNDGANPIWGGFWYFDDSVTVKVFRDSELVHGPVTVPGGEGWWSGFGADLAPFELHVGDVVTVTGNDSTTTRSHTLVDLVVAWTDWQPDGSGNEVYGTAHQADGSPVADGTIVRVEAHGHDAHRWTTVQGGAWSVDYDDPVPNSGDLQIELGVGGRVEVLGPEGNRTYAPWGTEGYGGEPSLVVDPSAQYVEGHDWHGDASVTVTVDACGSGVWPVEDGNVRIDDPTAFSPTCELAPLQLVTMVGDDTGRTRELVVSHLAVADVDRALSTVTGTAAELSEVVVTVNGPDEPAAMRTVQAGTNGVWVADFADEPLPEEVSEQHFGSATFDEHTDGYAEQSDEDGDATVGEWHVLNPGIFATTLHNVVVLGDWPVGEVALAVYDDPGTMNVLFETIVDMEGPPFRTEAWVPLTFDLAPGQLVEAAAGPYTRSLVVSDLTVDGFDFAQADITGTAEPDRDVYVQIQSNGSDQETETTADGAGNWLADFAPGSFGNLLEGTAVVFDGAAGTFVQFVAEHITAVGTATTGDGEVDENNPFETTIEGADDADITITETDVTGTVEGEWRLLGSRIEATSTISGTVEGPLQITFLLDASIIPDGEDENSLVVFRNNVAVDECAAVLDEPGDFPCVSIREVLADGDIRIVVLTLDLSSWHVAVMTTDEPTGLGEIETPVTPPAVGSAADVTAQVGDMPDGTIYEANWYWDGIDGPSTSGSVDADGIVHGSYTYTEPGVYEVAVEVTATLPDGTSVTWWNYDEVVVLNVPPTIITVTAPPEPVELGSTVTASATYADPGTDTHTAVWDWGDGSTSEGVTSATGEVTGTHTYSAAGVYTVTVTVIDDHGGSDQATFTYVVVYDPSGGFVTGGGWIDSPAGAYVADPMLAGKATFGFVSKYMKHSTVPTGSTEFVFHAGDLDFHSDTYDWLVIAGHRAMYKGTGTINGAGEYGFMLSAIDAELTESTAVDLFRIKIWDKATDLVVYDNLIGAEDDADPTTELSGGSIVIHKAGKK